MRLPVAAAVLLSACGEAPPSPSAVTSARFLGLLTETPEVRPGESATIEVLWVDPAERAVTFAGWWCWEGPAVDPLRCDPTTAEGPLTPGRSSRAWTVGPLRPPPGARDVIVVLEASLEGQRTSAFRRVGVRADGALHTPPELQSVTLRQGDRAVLVSAGDEVRVADASLRVEVQGEAAAGAGPLMASFFAMGGVFDPPRVVSPAPLVSRWSPRGAEGGAIWVLLRDARGGVRARTFRVRPGG